MTCLSMLNDVVSTQSYCPETERGIAELTQTKLHGRVNHSVGTLCNGMAPLCVLISSNFKIVLIWKCVNVKLFLCWQLMLLVNSIAIPNSILYSHNLSELMCQNGAENWQSQELQGHYFIDIVII